MKTRPSRGEVDAAIRYLLKKARPGTKVRDIIRRDGRRGLRLAYSDFVVGVGPAMLKHHATVLAYLRARTYARAEGKNVPVVDFAERSRAGAVVVDEPRDKDSTETPAARSTAVASARSAADASARPTADASARPTAAGGYVHVHREPEHFDLRAWGGPPGNSPFVVLPQKVAGELLSRRVVDFAEAFRLSKRTTGGITHGQRAYLGDILRLKSRDMMRTPEFGAKCWAELMDTLGPIGLWLLTDVGEWSSEQAGEGPAAGVRVLAPHYIPPAGVLNNRVSELPIDIRAKDRLHNSGIVFWGDIVRRTARELVADRVLDAAMLPAFGTFADGGMKSNGLYFGMKVGPWTHEGAKRAA